MPQLQGHKGDRVLVNIEKIKIQNVRCKNGNYEDLTKNLSQILSHNLTDVMWYKNGKHEDTTKNLSHNFTLDPQKGNVTVLLKFSDGASLKFIQNWSTDST